MAVQVIGILVGVRYLHDWIIDDAPGTYEVSSHFFWDWIVRPFAFLCIGSASASSALKVARAVAPSFKVQAIRSIAGLLCLWALSNVVFAFIRVHAVSVSETVSTLAANLAVAVIGVLCALRLKSEDELTDDAA